MNPLKTILLMLIFSNLVWGQHASEPHLKLIPYSETIEYLFNKAVRISGIPAYPIQEMPSLFFVSKSDLNKIVCPEDPDNCRNLAAVFDDIGYRILIIDDFDLSENFRPLDYSFVIHEIVHSLQYRARGAEIFNGCDAVFKTEQEAYKVQDQYLKEEGEFFRASMVLQFFYCDEEIAKADYIKSKAVWDERHQTGRWSLDSLK